MPNPFCDVILQRIISAESADEVLACVASDGPDFSCVNTSAALHRLAKHTQRGGAGARAALLADGRWAALRALADAQLHAMPPRNLSNSLWALATLRADPGAAWVRRFCAASAPRLARGFNAQQLANTAWSLAVLGHPPDDEWLAAFTQAALSRRGDFIPQHLSNILWVRPACAASSAALRNLHARASYPQSGLF
jgi:hypothetical protein